MVKANLSEYQSMKFSFCSIIDEDFIKITFFPNKNKIKTKPEMYYTKSTLTQNLQTFEQKLLSGKGFVDYK